MIKSNLNAISNECISCTVYHIFLKQVSYKHKIYHIFILVYCCTKYAPLQQIKLVIAGSCRNQDDEQLLQNMKDLSCHLSLENSVEFKVNVTHQELIQNYQTAAIGLHTMWNEHFGIGVVECMAAGLIVVANR